MLEKIVHIVLTVLLVFTYSAERLLPCAGEWDLDCSAEEQVVECVSDNHSGHDHDGDTESRSHGECVCPCHAPSTPVAVQLIPLVAESVPDYGSASFELFFASLSPPDHIPIV